MKKPRQFRVDEELLDRFDRVNDQLAVNGSEVVRRMIEEYTKEKEKELNVMTKVAVSAVENNKGGTQMLAVISENLIDGGYVLSLHENEGLPAYKTINVETIEEAKKEVEKLNLTWQEPDEDADGDVVLIGR